MKKFILFTVLAASLSLTIKAQFSFTRDIKDSIESIYPSYMITTNAGNTIIATSSPVNANQNGIYITKINSRGNLIWSKNYSYFVLYTNGGIIFKADTEGFFVTTRYNTSGGLGSVLFKVDSNGNVLWTKIIKENSNDFLISPVNVVYSESKNIFLINYLYGYGLSIQKLNSNGNILWSKFLSFEYLRSGLYNLAFAVATPDSGLIVSVTSTQKGSPNKFYNHLYKISKTGKPEYKYNTEKFSDNYVYGKAAQINDENLKIVYENNQHYYYSVLNLSSGQSETYDAGGGIFDLQSFFRNKKIEFANAIIPEDLALYSFLKNKSFIQTSVYKLSRIKTRARVQLYDSLGRICPNYSIPFTKGASIIDFPFTKSSFNFSKPPVTFSAVDTLIEVEDIDTLTNICAGKPPTFINSSKNIFASNANSNSFKIYPNPVKNQLNILLNANESSVSSIQILNTNGSIVLSQPATIIKGKNNISFNVNNTKAGIYFLKVSTNNNSIIQKFVKQ